MAGRHQNGRRIAEQPSSKTESSSSETARETPIVCLGASAGGLEALQQFLDNLPSHTGAAYVVVLHLSPDFRSHMSELLARHTEMHIEAARHGDRLTADTLHIIPRGKNMALVGGRLELTDQDRTPGHGVNMPIDLFLKSLATEAAERSIGVILSGTGSDGSRGIQFLKDAGGIVLVQEPESAAFDGMPGSALETGSFDRVGDPADLASVVAQLVAGRLPRPSPPILHDLSQAHELSPVLQTLLDQLGLDLSYLRPAMLQRRIRRRMTLLDLSSLEDYVQRLSSDFGEVASLRRDLFIGVTGFFRDLEAFDALKRCLASELLRHEPESQLRIWVPACSTGEEVYSVAILVSEALAAFSLQRDFKIFATDIDEEALARTSAAVYTAASVADLSPARLSRYFENAGNAFRVRSSLRERVICARHDLVRDPPFTRLDLVSCRNFLIYLQPEVQSQVVSALHFSLRKKGILFLGTAEAVGRLESEFDVVDAGHRLFRKSREVVLPGMRRRSGARDPLVGVPVLRGGAPWQARERESALRQIVDVVLEGEGRSAAVATTDGLLVEVLCDALRVFRVHKGEPTKDLTRLVAKEAATPLLTGLQHLKRGDPQLNFRLTLSGEPPTNVTMKLRALPPEGNLSSRVLVLFEPSQPRSEDLAAEAIATDEVTARRLDELEHELWQTRETLQATIEELQASNEEHQSTNEELVASNEELQSTNEELHSVNEELLTVNADYQNKIQELAVMAADVDNLIRNTDVGILFLDRELRIRRFTPAIERVIKLVDHDIGRSIEHLAHNLGADFVDALQEVLRGGETLEREAQGAKGGWLLIRALPYVISPDTREGVVITAVDVTLQRNAHEMTRVVNEQLEHANVELSRQSSELEDLFSIVAHDLKRPVIALDGLLELLARSESPTRESDELLAAAQEECRRMSRMLHDLGRLSSLTQSEIEAEEVQLDDWFEGVVARFRGRAEERQVRLNVTCDGAKIRIAKGVLEESVANLLENALNYGTSNPQPRIDASCQITDGEMLIAVRDNGKGIETRNQSKIFDPFRRLDPDMAEGSGIGLVAARRLVSTLGGLISVSSEVGQGAKFLIRVPLGEPVSPRPSRARVKPQVLLVEDDALDSKAIVRYAGADYEFTTATRLAEAEAYLAGRHFDLVILDLSLPDGHGLEFIQRLRGVHRRDTPVVVVTGRGEGIAPSAMTATIGGFLPKSELGTSTVQTVIKNAIRAAGGRQPADEE